MAMATQLSENSHQGFEGIKAGLCLASMEAKSNDASGMPVCLWRNGIRSRSSGKERDAETGLDYFGFRYYSGAQGRWTSPDEPFADQHPADPQSWNLYGYVRNNPLRYIDPDGHAEGPPDLGKVIEILEEKQKVSNCANVGTGIGKELFNEIKDATGALAISDGLKRGDFRQLKRGVETLLSPDFKAINSTEKKIKQHIFCKFIHSA
jgi:RHS repeat-associated protein